mmetsp:Transcript_32955/g.70683  ORF Transcript_32955/g.70683 Transcript_32955/m.70683 type:complete len:330 (+) Transcript_32955:661-1650(+)
MALRGYLHESLEGGHTSMDSRVVQATGDLFQDIAVPLPSKSCQPLNCGQTRLAVAVLQSDRDRVDRVVGIRLRVLLQSPQGILAHLLPRVFQISAHNFEDSRIVLVRNCPHRLRDMPAHGRIRILQRGGHAPHGPRLRAIDELRERSSGRAPHGLVLVLQVLLNHRKREEVVPHCNLLEDVRRSESDSGTLVLQHLPCCKCCLFVSRLHAAPQSLGGCRSNLRILVSKQRSQSLEGPVIAPHHNLRKAPGNEVADSEKRMPQTQKALVDCHFVAPRSDLRDGLEGGPADLDTWILQTQRYYSDGMLVAWLRRRPEHEGRRLPGFRFGHL